MPLDRSAIRRHRASSCTLDLNHSEARNSLAKEADLSTCMDLTLRAQHPSGFLKPSLSLYLPNDSLHLVRFFGCADGVVASVLLKNVAIS